MFAKRALRAIDDSIRCNPQQPGGKGHSAPLVGLQIGERLVEHFRRYIFSGCAVVYAAGNEAVYAVEMQFVKRIKSRRIVLRRFDKPTLRRRCGSASLLWRRALGRSFFPSGAYGSLHRSLES